MKKSYLLLLLLLTSTISFAQKVKIKDDIAKVDGTEYLNYEKRTMGNEVSISGLQAGEEEISAMWLNYSDPNRISDSNPEGKVRWIEVNFLTLDMKCELSSRGNKGLVKLLYQSDIYVDGVLNAKNVDKFVRKYGMRFSENRPGNNVNIIINNN